MNMALMNILGFTIIPTRRLRQTEYEARLGRNLLAVHDDETLSEAVIEAFGFHTKAALAFMRPLYRLAEGHGPEAVRGEIEQIKGMSLPDRALAETITVNSQWRLDPSMEQKTITLRVRVGYPGSRVSDLFIGTTKVQVPNQDILGATLGEVQVKNREDGYLAEEGR